MVAVQHTEEFPSEATPLLNNSPAESDESNVPISFGRGFTIVSAMGLLLFTQGILDFACNCPGAAPQMTEPVLSYQHVHDDNGTVGYCSGSRCVFRNNMVYFSLSSMFKLIVMAYAMSSS